MHVQRERNSPSTGSRQFRRLPAHTAAVSVRVWSPKGSECGNPQILACRALTRRWIHRELARGRTGLAAFVCRSRGEGGLACSARALPRAGQLVAGQLITAPVTVTSCPATSCPALGRARALHGPHIRAGRGSALTPQLHDMFVSALGYFLSLQLATLDGKKDNPSAVTSKHERASFSNRCQKQSL
jgi:hypothetical protein